MHRGLERKRLPDYIKRHGEKLAGMGVPTDSIEAMRKHVLDGFVTRASAEISGKYQKYWEANARRLKLSKVGFRHLGVSSIATAALVPAVGDQSD